MRVLKCERFNPLNDHGRKVFIALDKIVFVERDDCVKKTIVWFVDGNKLELQGNCLEKIVYGMILGENGWSIEV